MASFRWEDRGRMCAAGIAAATTHALVLKALDLIGPWKSRISDASRQIRVLRAGTETDAARRADHGNNRTRLVIGGGQGSLQAVAPSDRRARPICPTTSIAAVCAGAKASGSAARTCTSLDTCFMSAGFTTLVSCSMRGTHRRRHASKEAVAGGISVRLVMLHQHYAPFWSRRWSVR